MPRDWRDEGPDEIYESATQLERTTMSWQRTALALGVNGALLVRLAITESSLLWPLGIAVLGAAWLMWWAAFRAYGRRRGRPIGGVLLTRGRARLITAGLLAVGVLAAGGSFVPLLSR